MENRQMPTAAGRRKPAAVKYRWRLAPTPCERPVKPDCRVVERPGGIRILGPSGDRDVPPAGGHGAALRFEHRHHRVLKVWVAFVEHGPVGAGGLEDGNLACGEALWDRINRDHLVFHEQIL